VTLKLSGGYFHITKQFQTKREGVQLYYENFEGHIQVCDASTYVALSLEKIAVDLTQEPVEDGRAKSDQLKRAMFMLPLQSEAQQKFLSFVLHINP
jgi:hypothetical protein